MQFKLNANLVLALLAACQLAIQQHLDAAVATRDSPDSPQSKQKCQPVWGLNSSSQTKLTTSFADSFAFTVSDITLPLFQTSNGSNNANSNAVHAAMKLLAAFDAQLYGDQDQLSSAADDEADGRQHHHDTATNIVRFKRNRLLSSGLNLTMLNIHLYEHSEPQFAIGINIANTTLVGQFQYQGFLPAISLIGSDHSRLAGHYRMTIDNLLLNVASNLTKQFVGDQQTNPQHQYQLASNELSMNISQLGYISIEILDANDSSRPTSNYVLKVLQRVLQKSIKRTYNTFEDYIRQTLENEARQFIDCELTRFSPLLAENIVAEANTSASTKSNTNSNGLKTTTTIIATTPTPNITYLDDLAKIIGTEMTNSHLDRIRLPDFEYQRHVFGSDADISFTNGSLSGFDNVKLPGETRVKLMGENLIVNASVGWFDLKPRYNWTLYFGSHPPIHARHSQQDAISNSHSTDTSQLSLSLVPDRTNNATTNSSCHHLEHLQPDNNQTANGRTQTSQNTNSKPMAKGFVAFSIKAVEFDAVISRSVRTQSRMIVDELTIKRLDTPKMDIGGLPGMNRLTRGAVNFFMGRLKQRLVSSIQPALKLELERSLNRLAVFD